MISISQRLFSLSLSHCASNSFSNLFTFWTVRTNNILGDIAVLEASRAKIKAGFQDSNNTKPLDARIKEIDEISTFLKRNVVQGQKKENKYHLNIHKHTELGNNDSVKKAKKVLVQQGGGCCGGANAKI